MATLPCKAYRTENDAARSFCGECGAAVAAGGETDASLAEARQILERLVRVAAGQEVHA